MTPDIRISMIFNSCQHSWSCRKVSSKSGVYCERRPQARERHGGLEKMWRIGKWQVHTRRSHSSHIHFKLYVAVTWKRFNCVSTLCAAMTSVETNFSLAITAWKGECGRICPCNCSWSFLFRYKFVRATENIGCTRDRNCWEPEGERCR